MDTENLYVLFTIKNSKQALDINSAIVVTNLIVLVWDQIEWLALFPGSPGTQVS